MGLFGGGSAKRAAAHAARMRELGQQKYEEKAAEAVKGFSPYINAGTGALTQYQSQAAELGDLATQLYSDPSEFELDFAGYEQSPGYKFQLEEGRKALERSASANKLGSGALGKALTRYGQGFASRDYQNYLRNQIQNMNAKLAGRQAMLGSRTTALGVLNPLIQTGYGATGQKAAYEMDVARSAGNSLADQGSIYASGMMAKDNQLKNLGSGLLSMAGAAVGGALGGPVGANVGSQVGGSIMGNQNTTPPYIPTQSTGTSGVLDRYYQDSNLPNAQSKRTQSSYLDPRFTRQNYQPALYV